MKQSKSSITKFRNVVRRHYKKNGRDFPWRRTRDPYRILVSEIMLQQTQTGRVVSKYKVFLKKFPTVHALAAAPASDVLRHWQGLGYNRRALFLIRAAQAVVREHGGRIPRDITALRALPGIGPYTAGAVAAFAFNTPVPFIETNIRRAFIHHFFPGKRRVSDADILPLVVRALDAKDPRSWYWALMDYGAYLGRAVRNPNRRSRHYVRQTKFEGSRRQVRGRVLKYLLSVRRAEFSELARGINDARLPDVLSELIRDGFIRRNNEVFEIAR